MRADLNDPGPQRVRSIIVAAALEPAATGLILIIHPVLFSWLVLGADLSEPGQTLGRLAGITLIAFGIACWPAPVPATYPPPVVRALLIYTALATIYPLYLGIGGKLVGVLLWPAVALHAILTVLVVRVWLVANRR
jgi:hypothetical protein